MSIQCSLACVLVATGLACITPNTHAADPEPFPDEWFFSGADRPEALRSLEGTDAPEITVAEWEGEETTLADLRGKVVVLDFWATWCGPCVAAIPKNIALVDKYKDDGLAFIGVHDAANGWDRAPAMIQDKAINYPVALDKSSSGKGSGDSTKAYKLQFWPTYVAIDKKGIIRAAGLTPDKVEDVVKALLAEDGPAPKQQRGKSGFPTAWYYGGDNRPTSLAKAEGQPIPDVSASAWRNDHDGTEAWDQHVRVIQFVGFGGPLSMDQLAKLNDVAIDLSKQGAVFVAIADHRADWDRITATAEEQEIVIPLALDEAPTEKQEEEPGASGKTMAAFGLPFGPVNVIIDRKGVVRAAGVRTEHVAEVVGRLMAERLPTPPVHPSEEL